MRTETLATVSETARPVLNLGQLKYIFKINKIKPLSKKQAINILRELQVNYQAGMDAERQFQLRNKQSAQPTKEQLRVDLSISLQKLADSNALNSELS